MTRTHSRTTEFDACASRFTGKERDVESGNDYLGARYYESSMGRWMSPDWSKTPTGVPYADLSNPQTLNLYSYVNNNPLSRTDGSGHDVSICPAGATQITSACQTLSNPEYQAAQQGNNGGPNVPTLDQVGANGSGNITDANGNTVGTAIYSQDRGSRQHPCRNLL
jgi:RHS repeat-associated protein